MKLFHGSNTTILSVDLTKGKPFKYFGQGFYAIHIEEQAVLWSQRIAGRFGGIATVNIFEFDMEAAKADGLKIKIFEKPSEEWALFVMHNRKTIEPCHDYDIVIGPVADDNMATLFNLYEMNLTSLAAMVEGLKYKKLNSQYFFHSQRSHKYLARL